MDVLARRETPQGKWFWFLATRLYVKWGVVSRDVIERLLWELYEEFEKEKRS